MNFADDVIVNEIALLPTQMLFLGADTRDAAYIGGLGCGKTWTLSEFVVRECIQYPGNYGCVAAATMPQIKRSTKRAVISHLEELGVFYEERKADNIIVLPKYRSEIQFQSCDVPPASLQGPEYGFLAIDECEAVKEEAWVRLRARCRRRGTSRKRRVFGNPPPEEHWVTSMFHSKPREGYELYTAATFENKLLPADYVRDLCQMYPVGSVGYRRWILGELGVPLEGAVYPEFTSKLHVVDRDEVPDQTRVVGYLGGLDFGYSDPLCFLAALLDDRDNLYIVDEHYMRRRLLRDHARHIAETYLGGPIFADHHLQEREELIELGITTTPAFKDVAPGIDAVRERLQDRRLKIVRGVAPNLLREFSHYVWLDGKEKPKKENDHAMDALRYLIAGLDYACVMDSSLSDELFGSAA